MKETKNHLTQPLFSYSGGFLSDYLDSQLGRSRNTITSYRCCLRLLRDFIEERTGKNFFKFTFEQADRNFFLDYLCWVEKRGAGKATRNQRLACLKTYARYVMDCDFELTAWGSGVLSIPMATAEKPTIGWLREDALKRILGETGDTRFGTRDLAFMILMYESGARVSEMLDLHIRDLNFFDSGSSVRLHGKGKKTREVPIGDKARDAVQKHLSHWVCDDSYGADDYVFFTVIHGTRNRMSIGNAERIVKKYARLARADNNLIPDRVTPHVFRHTRGTHLLRAKMPLPLIGRFLGHVSLATTNIYTSCDVDLLREAIGNVEENTPEMQEKAIWENDSEMLSKLCGLT
jgi:site-specific recombinase XerD